MNFDKIKTLFNEDAFRINGFSFEMRERGGALVGGVCGILCSDSENVVIKLFGGEAVRISGLCLDCDSYGNHFVEVRGRIKLVEFCYEN